jgi:hypothetical protein
MQAMLFVKTIRALSRRQFIIPLHSLGLLLLVTTAATFVH